MTYGLITSCSSSRTVAPLVRVQDMPLFAKTAQALDWWLEELEKQQPSISPREQYRGLGFNTLVKIQETVPDIDVRIVTGGQGLIDLDSLIVPYDFSGSKKEEHNIHQHLQEPFVSTVWWKGISQRKFGTSTPVADFVRANTFTVISCSKVFLRYIAEDVLSLSAADRGKLCILLSASSLGSVPSQLRSMIIPFSRESLSDLPGNRNDLNHRAALKWFQEVLEGREPIFEIPETKTANGGLAAEQLLNIFKDHPGYLTLDVETAYVAVKRSHGSPGGRTFFRGIYRAAKGQTMPDIVPDNKAKEALSFLSLSKTASHNVEDEALELVGIFLAALRQAHADVVFTSSDICTWAKAYKEEPPEMLTSPNRLFYLLKANTDYLQITSVDKGFVLKEVPQ